MSNVRFIGLDAHAETIAVAVAEPDGEVRSLGVIPNRSVSLRFPLKVFDPSASTTTSGNARIKGEGTKFLEPRRRCQRRGQIRRRPRL